MGSANMNHIEDTNLGCVEEFTSHYKEEMMKKISLIRECLSKVDENPEEISVFEDIKKNGRVISDLAMVYGYEGVEVIGMRIVEAVANYSDEVNFGELIIKLENATKAIEDAMLLIDEQKERKVIRELSQYSSVESAQASEEKPEQMSRETDDEQLFDIREDEKLISLLSDTDGQAVEIEQKYDDEKTEGIDADTILGEHYSEINFDIPKSTISDKDEVVGEIIDNDVLEIDFKNADSEAGKDSDGLFKKIGNLFGKKNKNRISYQE